MDVNFQFDWSAALSSIPQLLTGIPYTLLISFGGLAIGFVIGWHEAQCQSMWQHAKGYWEATRETPRFWV